MEVFFAMHTTTNKKFNRKTFFKITISLILVVILYFTVDKNSIFANFRILDWRYVPVILALIVTNYIVSSYRWKYLLNIYEGAEEITVVYLMHLYFIGSFFNNFMPTSIGGDVFKIYKLGGKLKNNAAAFSATFMERMTGVVALVFIAILGFIVTFFRGYSGFEQNFYSLGIVCALLVLVFGAGWFIGLEVLNILRKRLAILEKIYSSLVLYKNAYKVLFVAFITSFIVQFCAIFSQIFIFIALGIPLDLFRSFFIFPIIILASFFIPSVNGIGVQDFLYKFSNAFLAVSTSTALAASILYHLFRLFISLIGGLLYAMGKSD